MAYRTIAFAAALMIAAAGCRSFRSAPSADSAPWPPPSPNPQPSPSGVIQESVVGGYGVIFDNEAQAKKGGELPRGLQWGPYFSSGEWQIPYNLFMIKAAGKCYVDNQYEVVYHDSNSTEIHASPGQKDHVLMMNTFDCAGAKVRLLNRTYLLKTDGWYSEGVLVHSFPKAGSQ